MRCDQSRRLFAAYWDDESTQAEKEWLETHFAACETCRSEYESFARMLEWVGSLPRVEVAPGLAERALARARRASPAPDRIPSFAPRWIPITATAALIGLAAAATLQWVGPASERYAARDPSPSVVQPVLVPSVTPPAAVGDPGMPSADAAQQVAVAVTDSLFDHSEDVEFILDPVTLHKGRAHTVSRLAQPQVKGEVAVITF
jgi:anti-sigma factor RsiW